MTSEFSPAASRSISVSKNQPLSCPHMHSRKFLGVQKREASAGVLSAKGCNARSVIEHIIGGKENLHNRKQLAGEVS